MRPVLFQNQHRAKTLLWGAIPLITGLLLVLGISVMNIGTNPEELSGRHKLLPVLSETLSSILFVLAFVSTVILVGLIILGKRERRRKQQANQRGKDPQRSSMTQLMIFLSTLLLPVLVLFYLYHTNRQQVETNLQQLFAFFRELSAFLQGDAALPVHASPFLGYTLFGILSFLFLVFILLGIWLLWGDYPDVPDITSAEEPATESLLQTIDASLETLASNDDPRRGIITTYRHFEELLAEYGFVRQPAATPLEFMRAALGHFPIPSAHIQGLTALFHQAKFSHHPMQHTEKIEALSHLEAIRVSLTNREPPDAYIT
jgi:hypothetical protein